MPPKHQITKIHQTKNLTKIILVIFSALVILWLIQIPSALFILKYINI